jgi:molybdate transport system regulatory protein
MIKKVTEGAVNCEVLIEIPGGQTIASIVTRSSVESLGLNEGMTAYAIMKASNVMIGVD